MGISGELQLLRIGIVERTTGSGRVRGVAPVASAVQQHGTAGTSPTARLMVVVLVTRVPSRPVKFLMVKSSLTVATAAGRRAETGGVGATGSASTKGRVSPR